MGILKQLLNPDILKKPVDLSLLVTDFHSHLIPGIDDGVNNMDDAIDLIKQFKQLGYKKLITTPHIQDEFYKNNPEIILKGLQEVKAAVAAANIEMELEAAAEYLIDDGFLEKFSNQKLMTFGDNHLLIEFSYYSPHPDLKNILFNLQLEGYKLVLAHPERYTYWHNNFKSLQELKDREVLFQLNTVSLSGHYGKEAKAMAEKMIRHKMIDFIGSDMHNWHYMTSLLSACYKKSLKTLMDSGKLLNSTL
jgi:protein-tyrosine phosphatase